MWIGTIGIISLLILFDALAFTCAYGGFNPDLLFLIFHPLFQLVIIFGFGRALISPLYGNKRLANFFLWLSLGFLTAFNWKGVSDHLLEMTLVHSNHMFPSLKSGDRFFWSKLRTPRKGDIGVWIQPGTKKVIFSRVVGLEGETIRFTRTKLEGIKQLPDEHFCEKTPNGKAFQKEQLNGRIYCVQAGDTENDEQYPTKEMKIWTDFFVAGDNRLEAIDSRSDLWKYPTNKDWLAGTVIGKASMSKPFYSFLDSLWDQSPLEKRVSLNHFYFKTVDQETYDAIVASDFLKETFAQYQFKKGTDGRKNVTAVYFFGEKVYLEIFPPKTKKEVANVAIALSVDYTGQLKKLNQDFTRRRSNTTDIYKIHQKKFKTSQGTLLPWFDYFTLQHDKSDLGFYMWAMEQKPHYIAHNFADSELKYDGISIDRRTYNAYRFDDRKLYKNVVSLKFELSPSHYTKLQNILPELGFVLDGNKYVNAEGTEFLISTSPTPQGLQQIVFETNSKKVSVKQKIGNSKMSGTGNTIVWSFQR